MESNSVIQESTLERWVTRMTFAELSKATDNFSNDNIIGLGKMGTVYKVALPNGQFLAVKRLYDSQQLEKQFMCELTILGRLRHYNLLPLLGFCIEWKEKILVYKYMSKGNLYDWLHPLDGDSMILEWPLRARIAVGLARGLSWLHHECKIRTVHLSISSKCILLDQNFEPKISNFERATSNNSKIADSRSFSGIWDLEYVKKDVYNFGIVLLELITRWEPSQISYACSSSNLLASSSSLHDTIDKSLIGTGHDGEIFLLLKIAYNCLQPFPDRRPTMLEVYKKTRSLGVRYGLAYDFSTVRKAKIAPANISDEIIEIERVEI
jgi:serine/threonine protein kinase